MGDIFLSSLVLDHVQRACKFTLKLRSKTVTFCGGEIVWKECKATGVVGLGDSLSGPP